MILSWADRRLGAIEHDVLSLHGAGTGTTAERDDRLHVVRDADQAAAGASESAPVMEPWEVAWRRSLYVQRALRDRQYCEQIRDAQARGERPKTADEFFRKPDSILEL